jgi:hypothetical protein
MEKNLQLKYIFSNILIDNTILMSYLHIFDSIYFKCIAL